METNLFFGYLIDPLSWNGKMMVLLLSVLLGGLIGLERQLHGNAAGLRTHIMVCVGATVITLTSVEIGLGVRGGMRGDPGHIAAQIVSGVGFLGAGAILREGLNVHGLTTAASIWATAGIGIALGASPHLGELAVLATLIVLITLAVLGRVEAWFKLKQSFHALEVEVEEFDRGPTRVLDLLTSHSIVISSIESEAKSGVTSKGMGSATRQLRLQMRLPRDLPISELNRWLLEEKGVVAFQID